MKIEKEKFDETIVTLDTYNSDLNLNISELRCSACPLTNEGFAFMWAGARATHGASRGKFCFEVKVLNHIFVPHLPCDEPNPHVVRVGFSIESSSLQLGEDRLSYGCDGTGKISTNCQFKDYGQCFTTGDVIMGVVNMNSDVTLIGFVKNGTFLGWAYEVPKYELNGRALFPHVLTKNVSFDVNFGQKVKPYFPLPSILKDYVFIGCIPLGQRQSGTQAPKEKRDCEMIMMCGLPGAGKSVWAANYSKKFPEKKFNVLGTSNIIDKMKIMGSPRKKNFTGSWDALIQMSTKCLNKMFEIGSNLKRNFILDQTNVYATVQRRKMQNFEGFQRKAVVVIPPETEYYRRCDKRNREEGIEVPDHVVLKMKAKFKLPEVNDIFNEVIYAELPQVQAQILVSDFNEAGKNAADCRPRKPFKSKYPSVKYDIGRRFDHRENRIVSAQGAYLSYGANESDYGGYEVGTIGLRGNFGSFGRSGGSLLGFGLNQGDFSANPSRLEESLGSFKESQGGNGRKQSTYGNYGDFEDNRGGFDDSLRGNMGFNSNHKSFDCNHRELGSNRGSFDENHKDFASNHGVFDSKHGDFYGRCGVFDGNQDLVSNHESLDRIRGGHNGRGGRGGYRSKRSGFNKNRGGIIKNKSGSEGDKDLIKNCDAKDCTGLDRNRRFDIFSNLNRSKDNESSPGRYSGKNKKGYKGDKDLINNSDANDLGCTGLGRKRRFDIFPSLNTSKDDESSPGRHSGKNKGGHEENKDLNKNSDANDLGCTGLGRKRRFDIFSSLNTSKDNKSSPGRYSGKNKGGHEGKKDLINNSNANDLGCTGLGRKRRFDIFSSLNTSKDDESSPGRHSGKNKGGHEGNKDFIKNSDVNDLGCTGLGRKRRFDTFSSHNTSKDNESSPSRYNDRNESGYEGNKDLINSCDETDGCPDLGHKMIFDIVSRRNTSNDNEGFPGRYSSSSDINYPPLSESFSSKFETNSKGFGFNGREDLTRSSSGKQDSFGIDNDISGPLSSNYRKGTRLGSYHKSTCTNRSGLDFQVASQNVHFKSNSQSSQTGSNIFNKREYGSYGFSWDTSSTNRAYDESQRESWEISTEEFTRETKKRETDNKGETVNYARGETSYVSFPLGGIKKVSGTESVSSGSTMRRSKASHRITRWSAEIPPSSDNSESLSSSQEKNLSSSYLVKLKTEPSDDVVSGYDTYQDNSSCTSYVPPSQSNRGMQSYEYTSSAVSSQQQAGEHLSTINSSIVLASQDQQGSQSVPKQLRPNQYYGQPTSENPPSYESTYGSK